MNYEQGRIQGGGLWGSNPPPLPGRKKNSDLFVWKNVQIKERASTVLEYG